MSISTYEKANVLIQLYPRNPDIIAASLKLLSSVELIKYALEYLEPDNGYTDVVRRSVIVSLPKKCDLFTLDVFKILRLGLTDDDPEVRELCRVHVEQWLGESNLSLPALLALLHQKTRNLLSIEYESWRATLSLEQHPSVSDDHVLFSSEPMNLFVSPHWELSHL